MHGIRLITIFVLLGGVLTTAHSADGVGGNSASENYPSYGGGQGNPSFLPGDPNIVEKLTQAKELWCSEASIPPVDGYSVGGFCSPVVADGRIFLYYRIGNAKTCNAKELAKYNEKLKSKEKEC